MNKKEYKIFFITKIETKEIETLNNLSNFFKVIRITDYNKFNEIDYFIFSQKSMKNIEYFYCCLFKNCTFIKEEWYTSSVENKKWNIFKNFEHKYQNYEKIKNGIYLMSPFERLEKNCFVFFESNYYLGNTKKIEFFIKMILMKALEFENVYFNEKKFFQRNFKKNHKVFCFIDKYCSNSFIEYLQDKIDKDVIILIKLQWIFDSIDFGFRQNILNYNFDKINSEVEFFKKKWFLNEIFPLDEKSFDLNKSKITIGTKDCDINIDSKKLSEKIGYLEVCQNSWKLVEYSGNKNGIFLFKGDSYKRIRGIILKPGDIISFGGGNNIPYGNFVKTLTRKVITFNFNSEDSVNSSLNSNILRQKELENELDSLKHSYKILNDSIERRNKILNETFPSFWKDKKIVVIPDTNIFVDHGVISFKILNRHCIILPRTVIDEIDGLKKSNFEEEKLQNIRSVSRYLKKGDRNVHIPSSEVNQQIIGNGNNINDEEIVLNAIHYKKLFKTKEIVIISRDNNMFIRCKSSNIECMTAQNFTSKYG